MDIKTKGRLIEKFIECSNDFAMAKKQVNKLEVKKEKLASLISFDNELSDLIIAGGVSTANGDLLILNRTTSELEVKKCIASYNVKSELTKEQIKAVEDGE